MKKDGTLNINSNQKAPWSQRLAGWLVHTLTASGACMGVLALWSIHEGKLITAFWLMGTAVIIDSVDGMFARLINIKKAVPNIDGAMLDNIVDFFTYTIVPAFFLLAVPLMPTDWAFPCVIAIILSSAYQFTQIDAKTADHFFKGFPSYWNIVIFYLFFWQMNEWINLVVIGVLVILSFIPIKYVYPSRLDYLTTNKLLRWSMLFATLLWGAATFGLLWIYPQKSTWLIGLSMLYLVLYTAISLYRTCVPLHRV